MEGMEEKLGAILGNPEMMERIMNMAKSLGVSQDPEPPQDQPIQPSGLPGGLDPGMLQKIAAVAQQTGTDRNQQALLKALQPYLSRDRIQKLEKAMRAAKLAGLASSFLGSGGLSLLTGR